MANLGSAWTETIPSDSSIVAHAPAFVRSIWTSVSVGLATSLYWPGAGGASQASIGELKPGASRASSGGFASSNTTALVGRAYIRSGVSRLVTIDSGASEHLVGTAQFVEHTTLPSVGATWVLQSGSTFSNLAAGTLNVSFVSAFAATPTVWFTLSQRSNIAAISSVSTGGFTSIQSYTAGASAATLHWQALGQMQGRL